MSIASRIAALAGAALVTSLHALREIRIGTELSELRGVVAEQALVLVHAAEVVGAAEDRAQKAEADFATHECEDIAEGALDAQAEAERRMFAMRDERAVLENRVRWLTDRRDELEALVVEGGEVLEGAIAVRDACRRARDEARAEVERQRSLIVTLDECNATLERQRVDAVSERDGIAEDNFTARREVLERRAERDEARDEIKRLRGSNLTDWEGRARVLATSGGLSAAHEEQVRYHEVGPGYAAREEMRKRVELVQDPYCGFEAFFDGFAAWSRETFGPMDRYAGVVAHIRKELDEVEANPIDLEEWVDVALLAMDGAWRSAGADGRGFVLAMLAKDEKNRKRRWPDWRDNPGAVTEHIRDEEVGPVPAACHGCSNGSYERTVCDRPERRSCGVGGSA